MLVKLSLAIIQENGFFDNLSKILQRKTF